MGKPHKSNITPSATVYIKGCMHHPKLLCEKQKDHLVFPDLMFASYNWSVGLEGTLAISEWFSMDDGLTFPFSFLPLSSFPSSSSLPPLTGPADRAWFVERTRGSDIFLFRRVTEFSSCCLAAFIFLFPWNRKALRKHLCTFHPLFVQELTFNIQCVYRYNATLNSKILKFGYKIT